MRTRRLGGIGPHVGGPPDVAVSVQQDGLCPPARHHAAHEGHLGKLLACHPHHDIAIACCFMQHSHVLLSACTCMSDDRQSCVRRSPAVVCVHQNLKTLPVEVVLELLDEEAGNTDAEWLLWTGVRGMIANPAFAFPLIKVPPVTEGDEPHI